MAAITSGPQPARSSCTQGAPEGIPGCPWGLPIRSRCPHRRLPPGRGCIGHARKWSQVPYPLMACGRGVGHAYKWPPHALGAVTQALAAGPACGAAPPSRPPGARGTPTWTPPGVSGLCRGAVCKTMRATTGGDHVPSPHAGHEDHDSPGPGNSMACTCPARHVIFGRNLCGRGPTPPDRGEHYGRVRSQPPGVGA